MCTDIFSEVMTRMMPGILLEIECNIPSAIRRTVLSNDQFNWKTRFLLKHTFDCLGNIWLVVYVIILTLTNGVFANTA
jgi:hypothetical protein